MMMRKLSIRRLSKNNITDHTGKKSAIVNKTTTPASYRDLTLSIWTPLIKPVYNTLMKNIDSIQKFGKNYCSYE